MFIQPLSYEIAAGIGYLYRDEVTLIKDLSYRILSNACCVNIGAGAGTSIIALLEENPALHLYSIDIDLHNGVPQFTQAGMLDRITLLIGDSKTIAWEYGEIDWLFIDGDHSKEGIEGDIAVWSPRMREGGIVLFHDYNSPNWSDVQVAVDTWGRDHKQIAQVDTLVAFEVVKGTNLG